MKRSKHGLFVFPPNKTLIWRRHCSIGQSCCSMTSKRSIDWFLETSRAWSFFTRAFALPTKSHAGLYPFEKLIKLLYFRSFAVSVLFARFHFSVIRKSLSRTGVFCNSIALAWEFLYAKFRKFTVKKTGVGGESCSSDVTAINLRYLWSSRKHRRH